MAWWLVLLIGVGATASVGPAGSSALSGAAALSPRPAQCSRSAGVWQQATNRRLQNACDTLARAQAALSNDPAVAEKWSKELLGAELSAEAASLLGQALLAQGKPEAAWEAFEQGRQLSGSPPVSLLALRASAIAAMRIGKFSESAERYRAVARQWRLLPASAWSNVLTEAALAVWRTGPDARSEAQRYLKIAEREHQFRGALPMVFAAQALLNAQTGAPRRDMPDLPSTFASADAAFAPQLLPGEWEALAAVSAERDEPGRARSSWQEYLESAASEHHREWVRQRIAQLPGDD